MVKLRVLQKLLINKQDNADISKELRHTNIAEIAGQDGEEY